MGKLTRLAPSSLSPPCSAGQVEDVEGGRRKEWLSLGEDRGWGAPRSREGLGVLADRSILRSRTEIRGVGVGLQALQSSADQLVLALAGPLAF